MEDKNNKLAATSSSLADDAGGHGGAIDLDHCIGSADTGTGGEPQHDGSGDGESGAIAEHLK